MKKTKTPLTELQDYINSFTMDFPASNLQIRNKITELLPKEKENMIDFHIEVMKVGLINEGESKWKESYLPKIKETANNYFDQNYTQQQIK